MTEVAHVIARSITETFHEAWSDGDVSGMIACCQPDVTVTLNAGGPDGGPLQIEGSESLRAFLQQIVDVAISVTKILSFGFHDGVGRAQIEAFVQHRKTKNILSGTYRQVIQFRDGKIAAVHEFHDGAKMKAFWEMVWTEEAATNAERPH